MLTRLLLFAFAVISFAPPARPAAADDLDDVRDAVNAYLKEIPANGSYDALVDKRYPGVGGALPAFFKNYPSRRRQGE